jgi:pimeloyl-ACP methyl ester carboxylesterase
VVLTVGPHEFVLDVSNELPFEEPVSLAASVHVADAQSEPPRAVLICWPGGSYGRAYWDMRIPGHAGYSFAEHMTAQGFVVVAVDHLGVGASSRPADGDRVNFETMSAAAASFVTQVRSMLAEEAEDLGGRALASVPIIGVGHSLGACLTVVTQARHRCYDAVALLGFTHGDKEVAVGAAGAAERADTESDQVLRETAIEQARAFFADTWDDVYGLAPRAPHHSWLHDPDVPAAVIAADDAQAVRWPRQAYVEALLKGHSARFAAELDCNVFLAFGDHDVPPAPHADVGFYPRSPDVTLFILRNSAHCHNFASTRAQLWDRIGLWAGEQHPTSEREGTSASGCCGDGLQLVERLAHER